MDGLSIDIIGRSLSVRGTVDPRLVERTLAGLGMSGAPARAEPHPAGSGSTDRADRGGAAAGRPRFGDHLPGASTLLTGTAGALFAAGVILALAHGGSAESIAAFLASFVAGAARVLPRAWRSVRARALDMNVLVAVAGAGAIAIGEYGEAAALYFLFAVAQALEARALDRVRRSIRSLIEEAPPQARVLRDGREIAKRTSDVAVGEVVVVHPGEKVPVDGVVVAGTSAVNEAAITGEPAPAEKTAGSSVFAGTLNGFGALEVRTTRQPGDTTLARIVHAVEEARANRAPSEAFVDRFARVYTPAVIGLAALVFVLPPALGHGAWGDWLYRALVLLVIACPCALVISTPVTIVSALAGAARRGILIKGGAPLDDLARVDVVALDKTGTLTAGEPAVAEIVCFDGIAPESVITQAASAELRSGHPLGRAVVSHARAHGLPVAPSQAMESFPGRGVRARVGGVDLYVGGRRLFRERGRLSADAARCAERLEGRAQTAVLVGTEHGPFGVIGLADRLRPGAVDAVAELRGLGVRRIVVITGDGEHAAQAVASPLAPDRILAGLLPEEKAEAVRELERHGRVAFVGDGINDAPALASATVGVAMAAAGSDVALETADMALMTDDLARLPLAIRLARKAAAIVRQNIAFALAAKLAFAGLAVAGLAALWMAVAADLGATLIVIANGLRALRAD